MRALFGCAIASERADPRSSQELDPTVTGTTTSTERGASIFESVTLAEGGPVEIVRAGCRPLTRYLDGDGSDRHGIVGRSPAIAAVLDRIEQVAKTKSTVLITGETGTGKELVARAVHDRSAQRGMPFVKVNCAAIPDALLESELFGHVRGAFTGATGTKRGKFALAHASSIFLDETGTMNGGLQAKLLRVLQEREHRHAPCARHPPARFHVPEARAAVSPEGT